MGNLTVKEKEHWQERIGRKVEQAIDKLIAETDPTYRERIAEKAAKMALASLGIADLHQRRCDIEAEQKRLEQELTEVIQQTARKVMPTGDGSTSKWKNEQTIDAARSRRRGVHEQELLAADPLGRQVLGLEQEKEELLDTIWLATSGVQIKELWSRVSEMLQQPPTALQAEALKLDPVEES